MGAIGWAFALSITPLLIGSAVFFYWYYSREWFARDADIESAALVAIVLYILLGLVVLYLAVYHFVYGSARWYWGFGPLLIMVITIGVIDLYSTTHQHIRKRAYVRVVGREPGPTYMAIWSAHFEQVLYVNNDDREFMFSYLPSYTYDWSRVDNSIGPYYTVDSVFIEIRKDGNTRCWLLPFMEKGYCRTLSMDELMHFPVSMSREARYGGPILGQ